MNFTLPLLALDGFGFSGSGLLTIYHSTVMSVFSQRGINLREYEVAGSSGGSWMAAAICSGQNISYVTELFVEQINQPKIPSIHDDIEPILRDFCEKIIPNDDGWKNCNGKLEITVTQVKSNCAVDKAKVIDYFPSRKYLIESMVASGFVAVPVISPKCSFNLNGTDTIDGFFTKTMPCPRSSQNCLGVSVIPKQLWSVPFFGKGSRANAEIYPGITGNLPMPLTAYFGAFLNNKVTRRYLTEIIQGAVKDAENYLEKQSIKVAPKLRL